MSDRIAAKLRGIAELPGIGRWLVHGSPVSAVLIEAADALEASERARAEAEQERELARINASSIAAWTDQLKAQNNALAYDKSELIDDLREAEARSLAMSNALRALVEQWQIYSDPYHRKCAHQLQEVLSSPVQEQP